MKIKFEFAHKDSGSLRTKCPHGRGNNGSFLGYIATRVGSGSCKECPFCESRDIENQVVYCDHRRPLTMPELFHRDLFLIDDEYIVRLHGMRAGVGGIYPLDFVRRGNSIYSIFNLKSWGDRGWQVAL